MLHNLFKEDNSSQGNKMMVNKQKFGGKNDTRTCWDISLSFLFPSARHKETRARTRRRRTVGPLPQC